MTQQSRTRALLDAVVAVSSELSLAVTLRRIVQAACALADAEDGALVRAGEAGPPTPAFPGGLRVPVVVRGGTFGELLLCGKRDGAPFTNDDEELVTALVVAVAFAIDNARLYEEARQRQAWLAAGAEITSALLSVADPGEALALVARRARQVTGADMASIVLPSDAGHLVVQAVDAVGDVDADGLRGRVLPRGTAPFAEAIRTGRAAVVPDSGSGATMVLPLVAGGQSVGALVIGSPRGGSTFTPLDLETASTFAGHAALALQLAGAQRERERLAVFEDRDRIARDLHDVVIQRLFAVGLSVQALARSAGDPVESALADAVAELDQTMDDIRGTIFSLKDPSGDLPLSVRISRIAAQVVDALGLEPDVRFEGPIDTGVPARIRPHLLAALREAVSNIARHAGATRVRILVRVTCEEVAVEVGDDGRGPGDGNRTSGLANLRGRAEDLGGRMEFGSGPDGTGTTVTWIVPTG